MLTNCVMKIQLTVIPAENITSSREPNFTGCPLSEVKLRFKNL
tara:strand:+ start:907 stop:1035 length:129 start_codon:yes stop_codon:yes gene_type:complete